MLFGFYLRPGLCRHLKIVLTQNFCPAPYLLPIELDSLAYSIFDESFGYHDGFFLWPGVYLDLFEDIIMKINKRANNVDFIPLDWASKFHFSIGCGPLLGTAAAYLRHPSWISLLSRPIKPVHIFTKVFFTLICPPALL